MFSVPPVLLTRCALLLVLGLGSGPLLRSTEIDLRECGAIGDGTVHLAADVWVGRGRKFKSFEALVREYPFVKSRAWTVDEIAWRVALDALPSEGGTIRVPAGHYVARAGSWVVGRDHVRLLGAGADRTIFSTATVVDRSFELAGYRHVGWQAAAAQSYPFTDDSGARGDRSVTLREAAWTQEWKVGELVFIRSGACRFDQDFGEMNEVAGVEADGRLIFRHPLARSYLSDNLAWAGETAEPWTIPAIGATGWLSLARGDRLYLPARYDAVTIDGALFQAVAVDGARVELRNAGRGNPPPGTPIA
ncbi:MAG TPA: hypothetical protein VHF69_13355, partial [Candidatus Synoicihabitans sp.]|nr:hypothetical protein [Candidatus Synoicihabitans sp.]